MKKTPGEVEKLEKELSIVCNDLSDMVAYRTKGTLAQIRELHRRKNALIGEIYRKNPEWKY